ncbi:MAG: zf-HC2 domain-containing protein [Actinobacteria bacterium]|nr:zf-HC2 domain-containing protein [Actinomycetota bacterium]
MTVNPVAVHREHCRHVRELMSEYLDGELDSKTAATVRRHARVCPNCRRMLRNLRLTVSALHALAEQPTPTDPSQGSG